MGDSTPPDGGEAGAPDPRLTEAPNPRTAAIDRAGTLEVVRAIQAEDRAVLPAVASQAEAIARLADEVAARIRRDGRLLYVGAGTSGRLGVLDAAECPPTFGTDPSRVVGLIAGGAEALVRSREGAEDDREAGRRAVAEAEVGERDLVLGIATSGTTPYVHAALREAARRGAGVGLVACTPPPAEVEGMLHHLILPLVGPEVIAGSTRMKAGTATKLVLNTLTTTVMIRLGKVHGNLMVDLRAVSRKLVERSLRMVSRVADVEREEARGLLRASGGSAKVAMAMARTGRSRWEAERLLDACGGFLGEALERAPPPGAPLPEYGLYPARPTPPEAAALVERLGSAAERLERAVAAAESRDAPREAGARPEGWDAAAHVAHLLEFERQAVGERVRRWPHRPASAERGDAEAPPAFEGWEPSDPPAGADPPAAELLVAFRAERARTLEPLAAAGGGTVLAERLSPRARIGEETVTLAQFLRGIAHHDEAHATRIEERLHPELAPGPGGEGA